MSTRLTLLDIARRTGTDQEVGIIEEVLTDAPELALLPARAIPGTSYHTYVRTAYPKGSFRNPNEGIAVSKSSGDRRLVECFFSDVQLEVDEAVVDADPGDLGDLLAGEAATALAQKAIDIGSQVYYGRDADVKGFSGFAANVLATQQVDGGSTSDGVCTSVWMVHTGRKGVELNLGKNATFSMADEWRKQRINDSEGNPFNAWINNIKGWIGLAIQSPYAIGRLHSIDDSNPVTQSKLADLLRRFPVAFRPNLILMNRRAHYGFLKDRATVATLKASAATATIETNYENAAVDSFMGIPIHLTDSITDSEDDA